jgi:hypothetical protein
LGGDVVNAGVEGGNVSAECGAIVNGVGYGGDGVDTGRAIAE